MFSQGEEYGQGLVEYSMIILLVALLVIAALALIAPVLVQIFSRVASEIPV